SRRDVAVAAGEKRLELPVAVGTSGHLRRRPARSPRPRRRIVAERTDRGIQERCDRQVVRVCRRKGYADAMKMLTAAVAALVLAGPAANLKFSFMNTDGKKVALSEFKGKVIILDFWATWCIPRSEEHT